MMKKIILVCSMMLLLLGLQSENVNGNIITVKDKEKLHEEASSGRLQRYVSIKLSREAVDNNLVDSALNEIVEKMIPDNRRAKNRRQRRRTTTTAGGDINEAEEEYFSPNILESGEWTRVFRPSKKFEEKHKEAGLDLFYQIAITETSSDDNTFSAQDIGTAVEAALLNLDGQEIEGIDLAEPVPQVQLLYHSNDYYRDDQPHYDAINLDDAQDITGGSSEIKIAVVDTGLDLDHEDLQNNIWINSGESSCNDGIDNDGNGFIDDCYGYNFGDDNTEMLGDGSHGTHCSGTIAADTDNGVGVAGVAGGKDGGSGVQLMTLVMFGNTYTDSGAEPIVYAADHGAHVISNSWGYTSSNVYSSTVLYAIEYATNQGSLITFAAGNDGTDEPWYPAYFDDAVAVAAVDNDGTKASFSCYGDWVDISGPGVRVLSTVQSNSYSYYWGTSMATPHVSGVLALGFSANPSLTREIALDCLYSTATDIESVNPNYQGELGAGLVNAKAFVDCAVAATPAPTTSNLYVDPSCDFEGDHLCDGWETGVDGKTFFSTDTSTPSSGTGPSSSDGFFVYTEASYTFNTDFDLVSPFIMTLGHDFTVTFDYHMYGSSMGTLSFQYSTDAGSSSWTELWSLSGDQGDSWITQTVDIPSTANKIRFWATTGTSYRSDICIDNIVFNGLPDANDAPAPTSKPTLKPTPEPTLKPTSKSTPAPTSKPTSTPTPRPTPKPTLSPTISPCSGDDCYAMIVDGHPSKDHESACGGPTISPCSGDDCYAMIVDGHPSKDHESACGGDRNLDDSVSALKTEAVAGTRCCGSSTNEDTSICSSKCEKVDYETALTACQARGLRLCTQTEILVDGRARKTGCSYDSMYVWTSTIGSAAAALDTAFSFGDCITVVRGKYDDNHDNNSMSKLSTGLAGIRCCGSSPDEDISVCSWKHEEVDFHTALSTCESRSLRLCTSDEIFLDDRAVGTGCGYDSIYIWTSTPAQC
eukprot:CAMPEP_0197324022 /NCGR_PEP_ID=MMETSP0891-20130614/70858_1 /TAXON_ID=44058 ORGANISM="Aureoumbra lagunensis, Strain CCMP1510" /NCGR_SAMPLE_ID=MMETSP0891 /ASSEMBLY_ACC=CAM_ASM_000534 /LENGTH=980 /DNA_ID=CAMNT_0042816767 /DNA_START=75 /DNA_END=3017 /DNA_ORIENTATION=-